MSNTLDNLKTTLRNIYDNDDFVNGAPSALHHDYEIEFVDNYIKEHNDMTSADVLMLILDIAENRDSTQ